MPAPYVVANAALSAFIAALHDFSAAFDAFACAATVDCTACDTHLPIAFLPFFEPPYTCAND